MAEIAFCKQYLSALDARPIKLSSDHIADARQYPAQGAFTLPKLPHPPHPTRPNESSSTASASASSAETGTTSVNVTLKPMKSSSPSVPVPSIQPSKTSVYDLKSIYSTNTSVPVAKIKVLYKKKPVQDSKTVAEVIGHDAGSEVEFSIMVLAGGGAAGGTPVTSPPAVAPSEAEKGLGGVPAAQGPSGKDVVVNSEFWEDLEGFVVQRIRDEQEGKRLVGIFKAAWEKDR